jgi:hypothetical protein
MRRDCERRSTGKAGILIEFRMAATFTVALHSTLKITTGGEE